MKHGWTSLVSVLLLAGTLAEEERPVLEDQSDRQSYSVGYQIGEDFRRHNIAIDPDILMMGLLDGLQGEKSQLSAEEMRQSLRGLERKMSAVKRQRVKEHAERNLAESQKFLSENRTKEGVNTLPSGLQYRVLSEGSGRSPKVGDSVTVHYRGTLIDGTEFDNSHKRGKPATFQLDAVMPGWTEGLQMMKEGSKWELFVAPELGYGERGMGSRIPPNSALIFEVELISIDEAPKEE